MRLCNALLILVLAAPGLAQTPARGGKPPTREQLTRLVAAGMDNEQLAKTLAERGVGFEPTGDDLQNLRKAGAQPALLKAVAEADLAQSREPLKKDMLSHLVGAGADSAKLILAVIVGLDLLLAVVEASYSAEKRDVAGNGKPKGKRASLPVTASQGLDFANGRFVRVRGGTTGGDR